MLVVDKYIELPTLEDYFTELIVIVKVRKVKRQETFQVFQLPVIEMSIRMIRLVLVDWVPVNDIDKDPCNVTPVRLTGLNSLNSHMSKEISPYGGIISFVSKKNNFAGSTCQNQEHLSITAFWKSAAKTLPRLLTW